MVFCNTLDSCRAVDYALSDEGIAHVGYHGDIPLDRRKVGDPHTPAGPPTHSPLGLWSIKGTQRRGYRPHKVPGGSLWRDNLWESLPSSPSEPWTDQVIISNAGLTLMVCWVKVHASLCLPGGHQSQDASMPSLRGWGLLDAPTASAVGTGSADSVLSPSQCAQGVLEQFSQAAPTDADGGSQVPRVLVCTDIAARCAAPVSAPAQVAGVRVTWAAEDHPLAGKGRCGAQPVGAGGLVRVCQLPGTAALCDAQPCRRSCYMELA